MVLHRWRLRAAWSAVRADLYRVTPLLALFTLYWLVSLTTHLNIGHRHILPTYPVLFILAGGLGVCLTRRLAPATVLIAGLLLWQAVEAGRIYPHYLAYFNPLAGGPENGHRHLVDSSLDWGQDLPGLKVWLDRYAGQAPVYLSYAGSGEPAYYDIHARRLPFVNGFKIPQPWLRLEPGIYCIGATILQRSRPPGRAGPRGQPGQMEAGVDPARPAAVCPAVPLSPRPPARRADWLLDSDLPAERRGNCRRHHGHTGGVARRHCASGRGPRPLISASRQHAQASLREVGQKYHQPEEQRPVKRLLGQEAAFRPSRQRPGGPHAGEAI